MHKSMPSCSKAPRGLFVLVEIGRVFTANAISPGEFSRQLLARYAIRARRNLPDKELRSLFCLFQKRLLLILILGLHALANSPCLHEGRTISYPIYIGFWRIVSEGSSKMEAFPADCPYSLVFQISVNLLPN